MLIRTDTITEDDLYRTLAAVNPRLELHAEEGASRTHARRFTVRLTFSGTKVRGDGRYRANPGKADARHFGAPWAATYDEWGEWLALLFELDPGARMTYYRGADDFHKQTDGKYRRSVPA